MGNQMCNCNETTQRDSENSVSNERDDDPLDF